MHDVINPSDQNTNRKLTNDEQKKIKDRFDILLESVFINKSLNDLQEALKNYNNDKKTIQIPTIGIDDKTPFEKVIMFGFIRNDIGYPNKNNDTTFLEGTLRTLEFMHSLSPKERSKMQKGGILLESANKVSEDVFSSVMDGGGIIDKSVKDTDRAIVIIVTLVIAFLSTFMKNTLLDKGILRNKTEEMTSLVAFYVFFTLLFTSLVELSSIDTAYMVTYLLVFSIINIAFNTYQEPKNQTLIKDHMNNHIINEYREMDNNLIITWMITSIGVIFV